MCENNADTVHVTFFIFFFQLLSRHTTEVLAANPEDCSICLSSLQEESSYLTDKGHILINIYKVFLIFINCSSLFLVKQIHYVALHYEDEYLFYGNICAIF